MYKSEAMKFHHFLCAPAVSAINSAGLDPMAKYRAINYKWQRRRRVTFCDHKKCIRIVSRLRGTMAVRVGESPARSGRLRRFSSSNPLDVYKNSPLRISKWRDLCAFSLLQREYKISFYSWFYVCVVGVVCRASHVQSITAGTPTTPNSINYRHMTISGGDVGLSYACYENKDDVEKVQIDFSSFARSLKTSNGFPAYTLTNERRKKGVEKRKKKFLFAADCESLAELTFENCFLILWFGCALVCHASIVKFESRKLCFCCCLLRHTRHFSRKSSRCFKALRWRSWKYSKIN